MARDQGLEQLLSETLGDVPGLSAKPMFGGWAWLLDGKLLCAERADGMLARVGKANEGWALSIQGVVPMISRGKRMGGWVRAGPDAYGDDGLRKRLLDAAVRFTGSLPRKPEG
jgi:hypothetical protein